MEADGAIDQANQRAEGIPAMLSPGDKLTAEQWAQLSPAEQQGMTSMGVTHEEVTS